MIEPVCQDRSKPVLKLAQRFELHYVTKTSVTACSVTVTINRL